MDKRVGLGVVALLLIAGGFGAGWLVSGQTASAERQRNKQPGKEDDHEFWLYPKAESKGFGSGGSPHLEVFTTPDDIATVAAWYSKRLESSLPDDIPQGPTPPVIPLDGSERRGGQGMEVGYAVVGDSVRGVKVGAGARTSPASAVTVFLSRADGEDHTHIVISFSRR